MTGKEPAHERATQDHLAPACPHCIEHAPGQVRPHPLAGGAKRHLGMDQDQRTVLDRSDGRGNFAVAAFDGKFGFRLSQATLG